MLRFSPYIPNTDITELPGYSAEMRTENQAILWLSRLLPEQLTENPKENLENIRYSAVIFDFRLGVFDHPNFVLQSMLDDLTLIPFRYQVFSVHVKDDTTFGGHLEKIIQVFRIIRGQITNLDHGQLLIIFKKPTVQCDANTYLERSKHETVL